ncbi:MAG TPA: MraY family glycosyltransferase [Bryobacteraceae bacterium]|nr:MraY family glycosyltransferase [Bryobacteraceae bacterium]
MLSLFDATCVAFLLALVFTPFVRDLSKRTGLVDRPDGGRKRHSDEIPRLGGVGVILAYVIALSFVSIAPYRNINIDVEAGRETALALMPAALIVFGTGLFDDIRTLRPWQKLIFEIIAAVLAYRAGFGVYALRGHELSPWISLPVSVFWLVGCTNALNLIDGMDGLAAGVGIFATLTSFVAALIHGSLDLAFVTAPLVGALLGFLRYNFNPASIFLGDSGSLLIGFLLGCFGTMWGQKSATAIGMTAPLIALAIPFLDTGLAIARRYLRAQPIFAPDRSHIHHRLLDQGLTPRRTALMLYGICGICAGLAILQDVAHTGYGGLVIIIFCAGAWMGVQHLGYAEFGITSRFLLKGSLRGMINVQFRLQEFERTLKQANTYEQFLEIARNGALDFGFAGIRFETSLGPYEYIAESRSRLWQLSASIETGDNVTFYLDATQSVHPLALSLFPKYLTACLTAHLEGTLSQALRATGAADESPGLNGLPSEAV